MLHVSQGRTSSNYTSQLDACMWSPQVEAWHPCPHLPGCITVNIGDALMALSGGVLKSNYHRVRMPKPGEPEASAL